MKIHETFKVAHEWKQATGTDLRQFIDILPTGEVMPNVEAMEEWLEPEEDECISEVLLKKHGQKAVDIVYLLFS